MRLDGLWKFRYSANPASAPDGFWAKDFDLSGWEEIHVPAHIQMEGYDRPAYVNTQYPWDAQEELRPGEVPLHFNPVADYVTEFTLPASFGADEVNICFEGVESGFARDLYRLQRGQLYPRRLCPFRRARSGRQPSGRPRLEMDAGQLV